MSRPAHGNNADGNDDQSISDFEFNDMAANANSAEERFNQEQVLDFRGIDMVEEEEVDDQFNINSADGDFVGDFGDDAVSPH